KPMKAATNANLKKDHIPPIFGLMNEAELSGWKKTACIPLKPMKAATNANLKKDHIPPIFGLMNEAELSGWK
ncbi:hypothetical protein, partial [Corynebacterium diphtheriae]|uniref:hypothetical protein n=1 Tax=Corynebacterium diphtheriae TaxID=1717 RepID=UPI000F166B2C